MTSENSTNHTIEEFLVGAKEIPQRIVLFEKEAQKISEEIARLQAERARIAHKALSQASSVALYGEKTGDELLDVALVIAAQHGSRLHDKKMTPDDKDQINKDILSTVDISYSQLADLKKRMEERPDDLVLFDKGFYEVRLKSEDRVYPNVTLGEVKLPSLEPFFEKRAGYIPYGYHYQTVSRALRLQISGFSPIAQVDRPEDPNPSTVRFNWQRRESEDLYYHPIDITNIFKLGVHEALESRDQPDETGAYRPGIYFGKDAIGQQLEKIAGEIGKSDSGKDRTFQLLMIQPLFEALL